MWQMLWCFENERTHRLWLQKMLNLLEVFSFHFFHMFLWKKCGIHFVSRQNWRAGTPVIEIRKIKCIEKNEVLETIGNTFASNAGQHPGHAIWLWSELFHIQSEHFLTVEGPLYFINCSVQIKRWISIFRTFGGYMVTMIIKQTNRLHERLQLNLIYMVKI